MKITTYTGGLTQTNGYLLETTDGNLLIDAPEGVADWLKDRGARVDEVLLTHQHYDHVLDVAALQDEGARIHAYASYSKDLTLENAARSWGLPISVKPYRVDSIFNIDEPLLLAGKNLLLAHVPGHAADSVIFHLPAEKLVFSGDTLFAGSIGRTDLPGGNTRLLLDGISEHLFSLPADTCVLPGHGPATDIGHEISTNPFFD